MKAPSSPPLAVCYDLGSASPVEIWRAAADICQPILVYDRRTPGGELAAVMTALGPTVDATDGEDDDVAEELRRLGPVAITTFSEYQIRRTAVLAARLGLRYHTPEAAERLTDKWAQREALREAGVGQPVRAWPLRRPADLGPALARVPLPAVLKPARGAGSRDTYRLHDPAQCAAAVRSVFAGPNDGSGTFVLEEMLVGDPTAAGPEWGDYLSVETLFADGTANHLALTGRMKLAQPLRETGVFLPSTVGPALGARVVELAGRAGTALGVRDGFTHTEIKLTPAGPRLLEVNGRLGGHVPRILRLVSGVDAVALALRAALGAVEPPVVRFDRVGFDYFPAAPMNAKRVVAVAGLDEIQRLPGVERVELRVRPGSDVDWRIGTEGYVCSIVGAVPGHEDLRRTLAAVDERLRVTYEGG